jgi:hypothetical protein
VQQGPALKIGVLVVLGGGGQPLVDAQNVLRFDGVEEFLRRREVGSKWRISRTEQDQGAHPHGLLGRACFNKVHAGVLLLHESALGFAGCESKAGSDFEGRRRRQETAYTESNDEGLSTP